MRRLNFCCVQWGDYLGRGAEYVRKLLSGVREFMPADVDCRYWVFTDDPSCVPDFATPVALVFGPVRWWNVLQCFRPDVVPAGERCLFMDLDQIITGRLDVAHYDGSFAMLRDIYHPTHLGSGVMAWRAGEADRVWEAFVDGGMPMFDPPSRHPGGDQFFTETIMGNERIVRLQDVYPGQMVSYKRDCLSNGRLPRNARVLIFHGQPRPHDVTDPWVVKLWNRYDAAEAA